LRVHGLQSLRIADASIMPNVPSANTSAAVYMIAEKASDMILGRQPLQAVDLGLSNRLYQPPKLASAPEAQIAAQ